MLALRGQWYVYVGWAHFIVVMVVGDDNLPMTHAYCGFNGWLGMIRPCWVDADEHGVLGCLNFYLRCGRGTPSPPRGHTPTWTVVKLQGKAPSLGASNGNAATLQPRQKLVVSLETRTMLTRDVKELHNDVSEGSNDVLGHRQCWHITWLT